VHQERLNGWYEIHQAAFGLNEGCIRQTNDHKIYGKLSIIEYVQTLPYQTKLSAVTLRQTYSKLAATNFVHQKLKLLFAAIRR
jgi:hypothetical protein